jgi:hypothetical protein
MGDKVSQAMGPFISVGGKYDIHPLPHSAYLRPSWIKTRGGPPCHVYSSLLHSTSMTKVQAPSTTASNLRQKVLLCFAGETLKHIYGAWFKYGTYRRIWIDPAGPVRKTVIVCRSVGVCALAGPCSPRRINQHRRVTSSCVCLATSDLKRRCRHALTMRLRPSDAD